MKTVLRNGRALSGLCLGTASMGSEGLSGAPLQKAFAILDTYYAMGGRFLDTANVYGRWGVDHTNASEKCIGMWLADRGIADMTITSKCCHYLPEAHDTPRVNRECALADLEESRRSLGLDTIPIYLLHRDDRTRDIRYIVDFCVEMVDSGKIGAFGFSNYRLDRVRTAIDYLGADRKRVFAGLSNEWSLAMEGAEDYCPPDGMEPVTAELARYCADAELLILPFSAVAHGWFDKLTRDGVTVGADGRRGRSVCRHRVLQARMDDSGERAQLPSPAIPPRRDRLLHDRPVRGISCGKTTAGDPDCQCIATGAACGIRSGNGTGSHRCRTRHVADRIRTRGQDPLFSLLKNADHGLFCVRQRMIRVFFTIRCGCRSDGPRQA